MLVEHSRLLRNNGQLDRFCFDLPTFGSPQTLALGGGRLHPARPNFGLAHRPPLIPRASATAAQHREIYGQKPHPRLL